MKSVQRRNFEAAIPTTEAELVGQGIRHFDAVWMGSPALRAVAYKIARQDCGDTQGNFTIAAHGLSLC